MNTNPHNESQPFGENVTWQLGYFHECMSGFEHQVAAHMMAEGMIGESLVLTRVIQDRYHAAKRNPFNEIECSDHYARAMASYGTFITACGFTCHGPKGELGFAPKWNKEDFKAPFTTAKAWGTYVQKKTGMKQSHSLELSYGDLSLQKLTLEKIGTGTLKSVTAMLDQLKVPLRFKQQGQVLEVIFDNRLLIKENQSLSVVFS